MIGQRNCDHFKGYVYPVDVSSIRRAFRYRVHDREQESDTVAPHQIGPCPTQLRPHLSPLSLLHTPFPSWYLINGINYLQLAAWSWQPFTFRVPFVSRSSVTHYAPCGAVAGLIKSSQAMLSSFSFSLGFFVFIACILSVLLACFLLTGDCK